jgi:hypothetical protein
MSRATLAGPAASDTTNPVLQATETKTLRGHDARGWSGGRSEQWQDNAAFQASSFSTNLKLQLLSKVNAIAHNSIPEVGPYDQPEQGLDYVTRHCQK